MKILIVPDSFKGSMTSSEVSSVIKESIQSENSNYKVDCIPFADGGEGFCNCLGQILSANKKHIKSIDIYSKKINSYYYFIGDTAIIESAACSGIQDKKDVMIASSYGTGILIDDAIKSGFKNIILGLGGSGCCDGGCGILSALGAKFFDRFDNEIKQPKGVELIKIKTADFSKLSNININFTYACDVENTLYGKNGAAYVFAPQKGASYDDVLMLDDGLKNLASILPNDIMTLKGGGAAGGICASLFSLFGGNVKSGFDILKDASNLEDKIKQSDIIITGEGKTDYQTLMGKLPKKIADLAKKHNKRCIDICGDSDGTIIGDKVITLVDNRTSLDMALTHPKEVLYAKAKLILK